MYEKIWFCITSMGLYLYIVFIFISPFCVFVIIRNQTIIKREINIIRAAVETRGKEVTAKNRRSLRPPSAPGLSTSDSFLFPYEAVVRAYCPCEICCENFADGETSSGKPVTYNNGKFCAAPISIPFDTWIRIPGYNNNRPVQVIDRGSVVRGNRLEVFFTEHHQALEWGRKKLTVTIVVDENDVIGRRRFSKLLKENDRGNKFLHQKTAP